MNVKLSETGFCGYSVHTIDPSNKDSRYHKTYCGISFCCATATKEKPTCKFCNLHGAIKIAKDEVVRTSKLYKRAIVRLKRLQDSLDKI
jgi:hypothetical protein